LVSASACSLLFSPSVPDEVTEQPDGQVEACVVPPIAFDRGEALSAGRFQHIDYNQGTATFWIKATAPFTTAQTLLDLDGIRLFASPTEGLQVAVDGAGLFTIPAADLPTLADQSDHFVSLRWDGLNPLSGSAGLEAHFEVRIDSTTIALYASEQPYTPQPGDCNTLGIGAEDGTFSIDQLVLYGRPLFVPDNVNNGGELLTMAREKTRAALVAGGGFDVLLATAHGVGDNSEDQIFEAWRLPEPLAPIGDFPAGNDDGWSGVSAIPLKAEQRVYRDGGFEVGTAGMEAKVTVAQNSSYTLEVLAHGIGGSHPTIGVFTAGAAAGDVTSLVTFEAVDSQSRNSPQRILLTFETDGDDLQASIRIAANSGTAAFHSVAMRRNHMTDGGFDSASLDGAFWVHEFDVTTPPIDFTSEPAYAGPNSACTSSTGSQNILRQAPFGMIDDKFYLIGAAMRWVADSRPGVSIANGSLFGIGAPYDSANKAVTAVLTQGPWNVVGTVGRRNLDLGNFNVQNDFVRYGSLGFNSEVPNSFCVDSAYTLTLETVAKH